MVATAANAALGGRSTGAITNALEKMTANGIVTRTQDKPKRYQLTAPIT